jgi:hypothetical protein
MLNLRWFPFPELHELDKYFIADHELFPEMETAVENILLCVCVCVCVCGGGGVGIGDTSYSLMMF